MSNQHVQHIDIMGLTIAGNILIALTKKKLLTPEEANAILSTAKTAASNGKEIKEEPNNDHISNLLAKIEASLP
ncbi:hypothetical protein ACWX0P_27250 [Vibrio mediterranei]